FLSVVVLCAWGGVVSADPTVGQVTHRQFQAVNAGSEQTYTATQKVVLEGIVLHNPADMLDPTPDDSVDALYDLSAQWQLFFQGEGDDHAGTAVFMAQRYDNLPWVETGGYSNEEWIAEMARLNAARFAPGDRIRVTGYFLSYKGKCNINEQHNKHADHDFTIELLERGAGLPKPEAVSLSELKDEQDQFVFDPARLVGGEYYQGRLIKIEDVNVVDPNGWKPDGELIVTDGRRMLPIRLGRGNGIYPGSFNLTQPCDVIGILDQEDDDGNKLFTSGYRLYVVNYDGNGQVLASYEHRMADQARCPEETSP
ncbi:MAG: hypothetical protein ACM3VT_02580, partial [Solirubrobacterales bacterium]